MEFEERLLALAFLDIDRDRLQPNWLNLHVYTFKVNKHLNDTFTGQRGDYDANKGLVVSRMIPLQRSV